MAFSIRTGSYVGDGTDNRSITVEAGFQPDIVFTIPDAPEYIFEKSTAHGGLDSSILATNSEYLENFIQAFEANGFQVGSGADVNQSGKNIYYVAIKIDSADSASGSYTGDGVDNRDITGVGFDPTYVYIKRDGTTRGQFMTDECAANDSQNFNNGVSQTNSIQDLIADGFEIGTNATVNTSNSNYVWSAFKDVSNGFETGTYVGDGTDDRSITVGFQPLAVIVKNDGTGYCNIMTTDMNAISESKRFYNNAAALADRIQAIEANGFQVGTDNAVNNSADNYYWIAWKEPPSVGVTAVNTAYMTENTGFWGNLP